MSTAKVREAQIGPSISSIACSAVTPQTGSASMIAQSSEDGPRSPRGPGWITIVGYDVHTSSGTRSRRNGQITTSGWTAATAARSAWSPPATCTVTSCPAACSSVHARWVRPLNAEQSNMIRQQRPLDAGRAQRWAGQRLQTQHKVVPVWTRGARMLHRAVGALEHKALAHLGYPPAVGASRRVRHRVSPSTNGAP